MLHAVLRTRIAESVEAAAALAADMGIAVPEGANGGKEGTRASGAANGFILRQLAMHLLPRWASVASVLNGVVRHDMTPVLLATPMTSPRGSLQCLSPFSAPTRVSQWFCPAVTSDQFPSATDPCPLPLR